MTDQPGGRQHDFRSDLDRWPGGLRSNHVVGEAGQSSGPYLGGLHAHEDGLFVHAQQEPQSRSLPDERVQVLLKPFYGAGLRQAGGKRRKIKISVIRHASSRRESRCHATTRVIRRNTNHRHMADDHHGQTAGMATLLVRPVDEMLRTHTA